MCDASASTRATIGRFDATVGAAGALLNSQANYGAVAATASNSGYAVPLNASGTVDASSVRVTGNSVSAAAYGNVASNTVSVSSFGALPTASLANVQANYGPVTAQAIGAGYRIASGPLSASVLGITGNSLAAMAVGNQASSAIASPR